MAANVGENSWKTPRHGQLHFPRKIGEKWAAGSARDLVEDRAERRLEQINVLDKMNVAVPLSEDTIEQFRTVWRSPEAKQCFRWPPCLLRQVSGDGTLQYRLDDPGSRIWANPGSEIRIHFLNYLDLVFGSKSGRIHITAPTSNLVLNPLRAAGVKGYDDLYVLAIFRSASIQTLEGLQ